jgi:hypothetical protein
LVLPTARKMEETLYVYWQDLENETDASHPPAVQGS